MTFLEDASCVEVRSAPGYLETLKKRGIALAKASEAVRRAMSTQNAEEALLFVKDIERKAPAKRWG
jgi:hypothetical protein